MGVMETGLHRTEEPFGIGGGGCPTAERVPTVLQPERTVQGWKLCYDRP